MDTIIQNPYLAFAAVIITGVLASLPGLYAAWIQRKRIRAEGVKEEAEATEIITQAYSRLQDSYMTMIAGIEKSYKECSKKMELLTVEVVELRKENVALKKQIKDLKEQIEELINGK